MPSALRTPLDLVLGSGGRVRALRAIHDNPDGVRAVDVARHSGLTIAGAQRAIAPLVDADLVRRVVQGRGAVYRWNEAHPFAAPIAALFDAERRRRNAVFDAAAAWLDATHPRPLALWWYGSTARGTDTFASDVDLALVGPDDRDTTRALADALRESLHPIEQRFALRVSVIAYTLADVRDWPAGEVAMWENLVRDVVVLHGAAPDHLRAAVRA